MKPLVDAFRGLFTTASETAGNIADTARFALENVDWTGSPNLPVPASHPIVDAQLQAACARSGVRGATPNLLADALLTVTDRLRWHAAFPDLAAEPDVAAFSRKFAYCCIIGPDLMLHSDKVVAGFSLQGRDTYYPAHAHLAEETYWIIGGDGDWKVDTQPWFAVKPGSSIYHAPQARHAMQSNDQPLLAVWLWTSDLDSEVLIVRY